MLRSLQIITAILAFITIYSCSSKNLLTMGVTEPAPVYVPQDIKTVGIINRSLPSEQNKILDKLEKILSAEGKNLDKDGAQRSVQGLKDELEKNSRFSKITIINNPGVENPGLGVFPAALSWKEIEKICSENKVDALFALSFYDTDAKIDYETVPVKLENPLGANIPALKHKATISTEIKTGWRIYDPSGKMILDEFFANERVVSSGTGINPMKAAQAIIDRKESVLQVSNIIGQNYALRILPYKIRVSRYYYVRGTNNFKIAKRRAQTGDWNGAAELWEKEISHPKRKVAGRACYNMAIINEINGDLNAALEWGSKAYTDYRIKMALQYTNILKNRIARNEELQRQTGGR